MTTINIPNTYLANSLTATFIGPQSAKADPSVLSGQQSRGNEKNGLGQSPSENADQNQARLKNNSFALRFGELGISYAAKEINISSPGSFASELRQAMQRQGCTSQGESGTISIYQRGIAAYQGQAKFLNKNFNMIDRQV